MDNIIVYVDDAAHAIQILQPMLAVNADGKLDGKLDGNGQPTGAAPTRWIVVGCAPRVTHHVSKWVTHSARDSWRRKWADKTFGQLVPLLRKDGDHVVTLLAQSTLVAHTEALMREHGTARVLDARRPKFGQDMQPVTHEQAPQTQGVARFAAVLAGATLLVVAD